MGAFLKNNLGDDITKSFNQAAGPQLQPGAWNYANYPFVKGQSGATPQLSAQDILALNARQAQQQAPLTLPEHLNELLRQRQTK